MGNCISSYYVEDDTYEETEPKAPPNSVPPTPRPSPKVQRDDYIEVDLET